MTHNSVSNSELLERTEKFVTDFFDSMEQVLMYHNLDHTRSVVQAAGEIAEFCDIRDDQHTNLLLAAWFHDTGYERSPNDHEKESVRIMRATLSSWNVPEKRLAKIEKLILSTRIPHNPDNLLSQIICDADMIHLADPTDYAKVAENLRLELNRTCKKRISKERWLEMNVEFLTSHCYFTEYGRKFLRPKKLAILKRIKSHVRSLAGI